MGNEQITQSANIDIARMLLDKLDRTKNLFRDTFESLDKYRKFCKERYDNATKDNLTDSLKVKGILYDACYVPYGHIANQVAKSNECLPEQNLLRNVDLVSALYSWRWSKKMYHFDPDLSEMVMNQDILNLEIDSNFLEKLPFNGMSMYIRNSEFNHIAFVCIDNFDSDVNCISFYLLSIDDLVKELSSDGSKVAMCTDYCLPLLNGETIGDCICSEAYPLMYSNTKGNISEKYTNEYVSTLMKLINLLMYILSYNADIVNVAPVSTNTNYDRIEYEKDIPDIESMDVGVSIGNAIRMHRESIKKKSGKGGWKNEYQTRIPHIRSGHWHRYWRGPRDKPEERELIVKWIPPIFINGYIEESKILNISHVTK